MISPLTAYFVIFVSNQQVWVEQKEKTKSRSTVSKSVFMGRCFDGKTD